MREEPLALRAVGPGPLRRAWYARLARAAATLPVRSEVLFESSDADPIPVGYVRPSVVVAAAGGAPELARFRVETSPAASERRGPPVAWPSHVGVVVRCAGSPEPAGVAGERAEPEPGPPVEEWVGRQVVWVPRGSGELWALRRFRVATATAEALDAAVARVGASAASEWSWLTRAPASYSVGVRGARDWDRGRVRRAGAPSWAVLSPERAAAGVEPTRGIAEGTDPADGHAMVFGASGAGKTRLLARRAARAISTGESVVAIDLHGDLGPALLGRLPPAARRRVVAVDLARPPVPGISALPPDAPKERSAAHLVASLKRLSPDGADLHWGFRLERLFEMFVRIVQESGGSLVDLYDLLTSPARRDAARWSTRRLDVRRFLDELEPMARRSPELLWSAAARLSKVVLVPALGDLLAPADGGVPVEELLARGRSIVVRLPFATVGPEVAQFAATLVLGRIYLGWAARPGSTREARRIRIVLDEVQGLSPRLVSEIFAESRKFGVRVLAASQYPERLVPELRSAVAATTSEVVALRVPPASAAAVGPWIGLAGAEAEARLPALPTGHGLSRGAAEPAVTPVLPPAEVGPVDAAAWRRCVGATQRRFGLVRSRAEATADDAAVTERLLLAVLSATETGAPIGPGTIVVAAGRLPGVPIPAELLADRVAGVERSGYLDRRPDGYALTAAGERRLGLTTATGARSESAEHRALLLAAFRVFARRGYRIEIVRQGRYDTTLPDGLFRQLGDVDRASPAALASAIDRARRGWAWRCFGGRDVHLEAEVSGALRPTRIRHGLRKAAAHDAFPLFLVADLGRARRVRSTLAAEGLRPDAAQVWTLGAARWGAGPAAVARVV